MTTKTPLEATAEMLTGRSVEDIRKSTLEEIRCIAEKKHHRRFRVEHVGKMIGRGNILGPRILTTEEIDTRFEEALNVE